MITLSRLATTKILKGSGCLIGRFKAMGCSCEVLMDTEDESLAESLLEIALTEARRIEKKWSRYVPGNVIDAINTAGGRAVRVDEETGRLIDFAARCHRLSGGLFDITSGALRKAWTFDGSGQAPSAGEVAALLPRVGWEKVFWDGNLIQLQPGMEIDLGGIGKEYAVDRVLDLLKKAATISVLVNFGGDIAVFGERRDQRPWVVGIERADCEGQAARVLHLREGALATSGDSKRFVMINGKRYGHILNPRTGWSVEGAPRSITVAADTCSEAGFFSTLGILNGVNAESFLKRAGVRHWCHSEVST